MAGHIQVPQGSIFIDPREVAAFVFSSPVTDKRAAQLTVYLKTGAEIHFLGDRASAYHKALKDRFPYRDERLYELENLQSLPKPTKKKS